MRPCLANPPVIRSTEFGGSKALFCIPLVASDLNQLLSQAGVAKKLRPDVVEWRADSFGDLSVEALVESTRGLRSLLENVPILFTLRISAEGGKAEIGQVSRAACIDAVIRSSLIDLVDVELCNGPQFLNPIIRSAHDHGTLVIFSFHDFQGTPDSETLLRTISDMAGQGADIAKLACMPQTPGDVLRLLQVTLSARAMFPNLPLCTMSMGRMGSISRVAGFLYGSDMAFAVGQETSAPGQIPIDDARNLANSLLRYSGEGV
jgi:3-dehydroquinate dehydratase-1